MLNLFDSSLVLPYNLHRLLQAVSMNRFDPMIGYCYAMALTSALAQRFCKVRIGDTFASEVSLYFLTIAASGSGKGSIWKQLYKPMSQLVEKQREVNIETNNVRAAHRAAIDCVIAEKKKESRRKSGPALEILLREIAELEAKKKPDIPVYIFDVQDVTPAALLDILCRQPDHSVFIADTEGRFVRSIDEDKSLSAMLNQTFVGETVCNSRITSTTSRVENPRVSITVAVQPEKLRRLTRNQDLWGEGFIARVLPYFATPMLQPSLPIGEIMDSVIMEWWQDKVNALFHMKVRKDVRGLSQPYWLEFDSDAYRLFESYAQQFQSMRTIPANMGLIPNLARLPEQTARIAAIYHILEHQDPFGSKISGQMMQLGINAAMFFLGHTRRLYMEFNPDAALQLIPRICGFLKSLYGTKSYVTVREIYNAIGSIKTGLHRALHWLWQQGVIVWTPEYETTPNFSGWTTIRSYGFNINFQALQIYPD